MSFGRGDRREVTWWGPSSISIMKNGSGEVKKHFGIMMSLKHDAPHKERLSFIMTSTVLGYCVLLTFTLLCLQRVALVLVSTHIMNI